MEICYYNDTYIYIQGIHKKMVRCGGYLCVNRTILLCTPCIMAVLCYIYI
jgi:hypothetical protein